MNTRQRYPSDLTDLQWDNIEHLFPQAKGKSGRPRTYPLREIVNAALYHLAQGFSQFPRPISRIPVLETMPSITGFERQPSGSGANTWANSCAGVGNPNCRRTRACSGVSRVACTTRPKRVRRSISP